MEALHQPLQSSVAYPKTGYPGTRTRDLEDPEEEELGIPGAANHDARVLPQKGLLGGGGGAG